MGFVFHREVTGGFAGTKELTGVQVWAVNRGKALAGYSPLVVVRGLFVVPVVVV